MKSMFNAKKGQISIGMSIAAIGLLTVIVAFAKDMKKQPRKMTAFVGIAILIVGLLPVLGFAQNSFLANDIGSLGGAQPTSVGGVPDSTDEGKTVSCPGISAVTATLSAINEETGAAVGGNHKYSIGGSAWATLADLGTKAMGPGNKLDVLWGDNQTTATGSGAYFSELKSYTVGCTDFVAGSNGGKPIGLFQNGTTLTMSFIEKGTEYTDAIANKSLGAGDSVTFDFELKGSNDAGYPYGGILTLELNKTSYNEQNTVMSLSGVELTKVNTPSTYTISNTENFAQSFDVPIFLGTTPVTGSLYLETDADNAPDTPETDVPTSHPYLTFNPKNYYFDEDKYSIEGPAVADEKNQLTYNQATLARIGIL